MKPAEFYKILADFVKEDAYWRALQIGDTVYEEIPRGFENDYHEMKIESIDIDERKIEAHERTNPNYVRTLTHFLTQEEFNKL